MTSSNTIPPLVEPDWLLKNLTNVSILDATFHLPSVGRDADAEFLQARIQGARRFNIDAPGLSDQASSLPHMLPSAAEFGDAVKALGVRASRPVVVYARNDNYFGASRAAWMFRLFGKNDTSVLHGGWSQWKGPVESGPLKPFEANNSTDDVFEPVFNADLVRNMEQIVAHSRNGDALIVDARSAERFAGTGTEPRPGQRVGHIPGSICLPYREVFNNDGRFKSHDELRSLFEKRGVHLDEKKPVVISCGSGVSACNIALAMHIAGAKYPTIYDGSWSEYSNSDNPVATGN